MSENVNQSDRDRKSLKLFVLGESRGDPGHWSEWGARVFVLAESSEQALSMVDFTNSVAEVSAEGPCIICRDQPIRD